MVHMNLFEQLMYYYQHNACTYCHSLAGTS